VLLPSSNLPLNLANHEGPVFHIQTDPQNLWDQETGIYVWGNHNNHRQSGELWERAAVVDYYDETGTLVFSEPIGLRINGQSSRNYNQKGLRLYFDDYGSSDTIDYDFFQGGPTSFERLVLRGNRYPDFAISSAINEPLHQDLGHKGSRHRYVSVYLNNELWGAYSLRERLDDEFVEDTWQWADDDEFILIKDHEAEVGDYAQWEDFLAEFTGDVPFDSHQWFEEISTQIDLEAYIDWLMINVCGASSDNMAGKNLAILKIGHGPWEFITWDEDILYQNGNLLANHLRFYSAGNYSEFVEFKPPVWYSGGPYAFVYSWNNVLRGLMQNAEFKSLLRHRSAELLDGPLSVEGTHARIDSVAVHQEPEWLNHSLRWGASNAWYPFKRSQIESFVTTRHSIVQNHMQDFLELWAEPVELVSFALTTQEERIDLAWRTEREEDCAGFIVQRSVGSENNFETIATWHEYPELAACGEIGLVAEYAFNDTTAPQADDLWYRISWEANSSIITPLPWVETTAPAPVFALKINEFMAINNFTISDEFGEFDDWAEIYNPSDEPINTSGLFLTDNIVAPTKWPLPDTTIAPHGFLLVWCDNDLEQGPLHAGFKLSGSGEELGLFSGHTSGNLPIDVATFGPQQSDVSLGCYPDGTGPLVAFHSPTPGYTNADVSAVFDDQNYEIASIGAWPNPFNPLTTISFETTTSSAVKLLIFDVRGRLVKTLCDQHLEAGLHNRSWDGSDRSGQKAASGLYFAMVSVGEQKQAIRLVLVN